MSPLFSTFSSGGGGRAQGLGFGVPLDSGAEPGEAVFTTVTTHTWTVPDGVEEICVVCVGGGGAGDTYFGGGGGGGALAWKNSIAVTPGTTATIVVGKGGVEGTAGYMPTGQQSGDNKPASMQGDDSTFTYGSTVVTAEGGSAGADHPTTAYGIGAVATYSGADGGGNGGRSVGGYGGQPSGWTYPYSGAGGGGAGGYQGAGGNGGAGGRYNLSPSQTAGFAGSGGGGGGGGSQEVNHPPNTGNGGAGGGGVGIYGEGSSGAGGDSRGTGAYGRGGSGGQNGTLSTPSGGSNGGGGGLYGGGGGTSHGTSGTGPVGGPGGQGAVRIIWGEGRAFPSTLTAEADSITVDTY